MRLLVLALFIFGCTAVPFVFVWGNSGSWRKAVSAWKQFAVWIGGLLLAAAVVMVVTLLMWPPQS